MKKKIIHLMKTHIDKVAHILLGTAFYTLAGFIISDFDALMATIALAIAVEVYDLVSEDVTPDFWDIIATIILPVLLYLN